MSAADLYKSVVGEKISKFDSLGAESVIPHPLKIVYVNPHAIRRFCSLNAKTAKKMGKRIYDLWTVKDGDWDLCKDSVNKSIDSMVTDRSVNLRYLEEVAWKDVPVFESKMKTIEKNGSIDGCRNASDLEKRYKSIDKTMKSLEESGWLLPDFRSNYVQIRNVLGVSIGRYGDFFLANGGSHRLAMAKMINLRHVPCLVYTRHAQWVKVMESFFRDSSGYYSFMSHHPDLASESF